MKYLPSLLLALGLAAAPLRANDLVSPTTEVVSRPVLDFSDSAALAQARPSHDQVTITPAGGAGLDVAIAASTAGYPGVNVIPASGSFDFSGAGFVEARLTNTGSQIVSATLRVDNPGGKGSATGVAYLRPGQSGVARAYFASPAKGASPVDPANVGRILIFVGKNEKADRAFRIDSLSVGGRPGEQAAVNPDLVRAKPARGLLFGGGAPFVPAKQLSPRGGAKVAPGATPKDPIGVTFAGAAGESLLIRPAQGLWDLSEQLQVRIRVKNTGSSPLALSAQLTSRGGASDLGTTAKPLVAGATGDIVVSFIPGTPFEIISDPVQEQLEPKKNWGVKDTPGSRYFSHQTNGLVIQPRDVAAPAGASFEIVSIAAELPPPAATPAWLGQRPPVEGNWVKTFEDNFDGAALNTAVWNTYSANHWDKRVGFSKQNVLLGDGVARLRIEKRNGHHNDDPAQRATEFATGWLDTYGKWTQRYGYYEVRVKLPTVPSMFPAFWLMPERGPGEWPKYRRTDTKDGGMEFDVFEGQSMWGPYRTTFGAHWDAYMKHHKVAGTTAHYNLPDKDGFLTIGFLWTPDHVSVYSQGRKGGSWDSPRIGSVQSYVIFDLLPGGFEYDPLDPATLPADLVIDYIRVWQRKDLATAEDGPKSAPVSQ